MLFFDVLILLQEERERERERENHLYEVRTRFSKKEQTKMFKLNGLRRI